MLGVGGFVGYTLERERGEGGRGWSLGAKFLGIHWAIEVAYNF